MNALVEHVQNIARKDADEELDAAEIVMIENRLEDIQAPLHRFVHLLHPIVAFGIMPLFAVVNAGLYVRDLDASDFGAPIALGSALGLCWACRWACSD